jgi:dCMP deaminase
VGQRYIIQHAQINRNATGICAGKSSIAEYLVREHHFKRLFLESNTPTPAVEKSATNTIIPRPRSFSDVDVPRFEHAEALLDFVTKRWRQRWVTTDIWDSSVLDVLQRRPFFLLISVDAPVSVRWERFKAR